MFQRRIQLATEETTTWSIPCCNTFYSRRIQLPEDSDLEEEQEEQSIAPFRIESTSFLQHPSNLSRNPFARVEEISTKSITTLPIETQEEPVEELVDVSKNKYENEPDWTEMHEQEENDNIKPSNLNMEEEGTREEETEEITAEEAREENASEEETREEEEIPKKEERIPQIEEEVLHLLPLSQLSNELPPTMIHKKPSFEKSMYGEAPLMSTTTTLSTSVNTNRVSRFSMTEEDFLALKKQEEAKNIKPSPIIVKETPLPLKVTKILSTRDIVESPLEITPIDTKKVTDPLSIPEDPVVKQVTQRRSSIAQSILGDKLDDFTEKLAFIKKNIIMNIDSDDEEEEADNAEETLKKIALLKQESSSSSSVPTETPRTLHRRTSSLMDVAPTLARFMNQISGSEPSSSKGEDEENDDEELFDFTKVIEIGKNVKSFSEGFVGNGIRILNDVATRIKTSSEEDDEEGVEKETEHENWINDSYI